MQRLAMLALLGAWLSAPAHAFDVTCETPTVPAGMVGELSSDLDCTFTSIQLGPDATLRLNGHTYTSSSQYGGVLCATGRCSIIGPGTLTGLDIGINTGDAAEVVVSEVDVSGNNWGIYANDVELTHTIRATNVTANDNRYAGIIGNRLHLLNVTANANAGWDATYAGIQGVDVKATNVTANDNSGMGIFSGRRLRATGIEAHGNGAEGLYTSDICRLADVNATANEVGVSCPRGTIRTSSLTANVVADIIAGPRGPRVRDTICDNSFRPNPSFPGDPAGLCAVN